MTSAANAAGPATSLVPASSLKYLRTDQLRPNPNNPRRLFDPEPLRELRENIKEYGVLVPITVYQLKSQDRYAILDGERRFRCCQQLLAEGVEILIPANIVEPPSRLAGMLYMFAIHNYRESWELMPTALSLELVMNELDERDEQQLMQLTGLKDRQLHRCLILLSFPEKFRNMSLDPNPRERIPSNFWIELHPLLGLYEEVLPEFVQQKSRDGLTEAFVEKYRAGRISSIIHFRRILEAYDASEKERAAFLDRLLTFATNRDLETRAAFDEFIADRRRLDSALAACLEWERVMERAKVELVTDERDILLAALKRVSQRAADLVDKLDTGIEPAPREPSIHQ